MLIRRCYGTRFFLLLTFFSLLIFLPVKTLARERNLYFAETSPSPLKSPDTGITNDRSLDNQIKKRPPPHIRPRKSTLKKSAPGKPDIVLTNTLPLSLQDVIANTLKNNISIAVQEFQSKIRKEEIITQESVFDPTLSLETKWEDSTEQSSSAFANPLVSKNKNQTLELGFDQKLELGTQYGISFLGQKGKTNSTFAGLNPQYTTRAEINLSQP